ncbi:hypothetical protein [Nocardiopsis sp. NPDC055824]
MGDPAINEIRKRLRGRGDPAEENRHGADPTLQKIREQVDARRSSDLQEFAVEQQRAAVEQRRRDDAWIRERAEDLGATDTFLDASDRAAARKQAESELKALRDEEYAEYQKQEDYRKLRAVAEADSPVSRINEIIDAVKSAGTITTQQRFQYHALSRYFRSRGDTPPALESFLPEEQ